MPTPTGVPTTRPLPSLLTSTPGRFIGALSTSSDLSRPSLESQLQRGVTGDKEGEGGARLR